MKNKNILIIGGTGSWGYGLIEELLKEDVKKIKIYARNEFQMVKLMRDFHHPHIECIIGDIRDEKALSDACADVHIIYHLAAIKHVPICEKMPYEAIETNIIGTGNVIRAAIANHVEQMIYISTDKAVNPDCTYGSTKLLGEKLTLAANRQQIHTKFTVFRGGNLIGSAGSVIPLFEQQISEKGTVTLTDERMNRFFISIRNSSQLLIKVAKEAAGGEIFIPSMPSIRIKDLAKYLLSKHQLDESNISVTGIRPGEKLDEELISHNEKDYLYHFTNDLYVIIKDDVHKWTSKGMIQKGTHFAATSKEAVLPYESAVKYLQKAGV